MSVEITYGIYMHPTLINIESMELCISNITDQTVSLKKGLKLGLARPAEQLSEHSTISLPHSEFEPIKPDFDPTIFDINPNISDSDREALLEILNEFSDVFARSNSELGCTDLVEHSRHG
jgi:hypothetical protein